LDGSPCLPLVTQTVLRLFEKEGNMPISKLVGEGINGKHMHNYEESASGYWEWCNDCQCMVTNPCLHNEYLPCYERSTYIRLRRKYEAVEQSVQPTGGILRDLQAFSTTEQNPAPEHYRVPPTSG